MQSSSPPLTASVTGSHAQSSAAVHRPLSPSGSTASTSSSSPSPAPSPAPRPRPRSFSLSCVEKYLATSSDRPPLPIADSQSQRLRERASPVPRLTRLESSLSRVRLFPDCFATIPRGDIIIDESGPSRPGPRRGHRRRSTHVTPADLESFRREVLGIETPPSIVPEEENPSRPNQNPSSDPQFEQLNEAFASATMSLNSGSGMSSSNSGSSVFSGYVDNSSVPRPPMSPALSHTSSQVNGSAMPGMNGNVPMNAGHQMDLQHLYDMVLELSDVLKNNREMTKSIVSSAEDLMVCTD